VSQGLSERRAAAGPLVFLPGLALSIAIHSLYNHLLFNPAPRHLHHPGHHALMLVAVYERSEGAMRSWLGHRTRQRRGAPGADPQRRGERVPHRGVSRVASPPLRRAILADMLCLLQIHLELSIRAKGTLIARAAGIDLPHRPGCPGSPGRAPLSRRLDRGAPGAWPWSPFSTPEHATCGKSTSSNAERVGLQNPDHMFAVRRRPVLPCERAKAPNPSVFWEERPWASSPSNLISVSTEQDTDVRSSTFARNAAPGSGIRPPAPATSRTRYPYIATVGLRAVPSAWGLASRTVPNPYPTTVSFHGRSRSRTSAGERRSLARNTR
jgi:hypothetical protein